MIQVEKMTENPMWAILPNFGPGICFFENPALSLGLQNEGQLKNFLDPFISPNNEFNLFSWLKLLILHTLRLFLLTQRLKLQVLHFTATYAGN